MLSLCVALAETARNTPPSPLHAFAMLTQNVEPDRRCSARRFSPLESFGVRWILAGEQPCARRAGGLKRDGDVPGRMQSAQASRRYDRNARSNGIAAMVRGDQARVNRYLLGNAEV